MGHKSLELQLQLLNMSLRCFECTLSYIGINPIQAGVFWNHIGWGAHCAPSVSPLFVV